MDFFSATILRSIITNFLKFDKNEVLQFLKSDFPSNSQTILSLVGEFEKGIDEFILSYREQGKKFIGGDITLETRNTDQFSVYIQLFFQSPVQNDTDKFIKEIEVKTFNYKILTEEAQLELLKKKQITYPIEDV